jgi:hypothetical protein
VEYDAAKQFLGPPTKTRPIDKGTFTTTSLTVTGTPLILNKPNQYNI